MTADEFRKELRAMLDRARRQGRPYVEINAGELHRVIGGYPGAGTHRMPVCCEVMRQEMRSGDDVVFEPPGGKGASLTVRYSLSQ